MKAFKKDYQETLQEAALGFLTRNQAQHLGNDQCLFSRAVIYLLSTFHKCSQADAENNVSRAYGELKSAGERRYVDIGNSTSKVIIVVDPDTGRCEPVPVAVICQWLLDNPARRRLSRVN